MKPLCHFRISAAPAGMVALCAAVAGLDNSSLLGEP